MTTISEAIEYIVPKTLELTGVFIPNEKIKINYSAIFCQSEEEYKTLTEEAAQLGEIAADTPTGPLYKLKDAIKTSAGPLRLLKIRKPDPSRPQRGDADFTLGNYRTFREKHHQDTEHFRIMKLPALTRGVSGASPRHWRGLLNPYRLIPVLTHGVFGGDLINRGTFEMIELRDPKFDVLVYFSNPPLTTQFGME